MEERGGITLWKDVDRKIIENLDEKSILSICSSSKKLFTQICNDDFIQNLLEKRYPGSTKFKNSRYKDKSRKQFLLILYYWKGKMKEDFGFNYEGGNFLTQVFLLKQFKNINHLLVTSAEYGENGVIKYALSKGADVNYVKENVGNALKIAIQYGYLETVKLLIEYGANISSDDIVSAIFRQVFNNRLDLDIIKYLISKGFHIDKDKIINSLKKYLEPYSELRGGIRENIKTTLKYLESL